MISEIEKDCLNVTTEDVNRLLEVGRLLLSVLAQEELNQLQQYLGSHVTERQSTDSISFEIASEIGNTGVT